MLLNINCVDILESQDFILKIEHLRTVLSKKRAPFHYYVTAAAYCHSPWIKAACPSMPELTLPSRRLCRELSNFVFNLSSGWTIHIEIWSMKNISESGITEIEMDLDGFKPSEEHWIFVASKFGGEASLLWCLWNHQPVSTKEVLLNPSMAGCFGLWIFRQEKPNFQTFGFVSVFWKSLKIKDREISRYFLYPGYFRYIWV